MLRSGLQNHKLTLKSVKELDAFPKIPDSYVETRASGAAISIACFVFIFALVVMEFRYYIQSNVRFKYDLDTDFDSKLKINIDITVAMPCDMIGADILDVTNQNTHSFGHLEEEPTWFELSPLQEVHWDSMKVVNTYIRNEFYSLQHLLWTSGHQRLFGELPAREIVPITQPDACRLHGTLLVNKVAGNFHVTAGKSIPHPKGHAHLALFMREEDYNFSHRIEHFSFGDPAAGIIDPLDGDEKVTKQHFQIYQYFLQIVPTHVDTFSTNSSTYQYSVTEQDRSIDHNHGSHGVPGIFFKYDMSSIKVHVIEEHDSWSQFLTRLCGIVGGVFTTAGIINALIGNLSDFICCGFQRNQKPPISPTVPSRNEILNGSNSLPTVIPVKIVSGGVQESYSILDQSVT